MGTFIPSDEEKTSALPHVRWEMERFVQEFDSHVESREKRALELALLHARNLCDFFTKTRKDSEVECADFGSARVPEESLLSAADRKLINNQLSHLTYDRKNPSPIWSLPGLFRPLLMACAKFALLVESSDSTIFQRDKACWGGLAKRINESVSSGGHEVASDCRQRGRFP